MNKALTDLSAQSSPLVTVLSILSPIIAAAVGAYLSWRLRQVHILVNSQMTTALGRISQLERKLGLAPGEQIPGAPIITAPTQGQTS